jgi:hypothetical protein
MPLLSWHPCTRMMLSNGLTQVLPVYSPRSVDSHAQSRTFEGRPFHSFHSSPLAVVFLTRRRNTPMGPAIPTMLDSISFSILSPFTGCVRQSTWRNHVRPPRWSSICIAYLGPLYSFIYWPADQQPWSKSRRYYGTERSFS